MKGVGTLLAKSKEHIFTEHLEQDNGKLYTKVYYPFRSNLFIWQGSCIRDFETKLWEYQALLKNTNIKFADILELECLDDESIKITQKLIQGPTLDSYIFKNIKSRLLPAVRSLLTFFSEKEFYKKASIDLNLSNFVIDENNQEVTYIDLTPPLIRSFEKKENSFLLDFYSSLCFNQTSQLAELICNLFKKEVKNVDQYNETFLLFRDVIGAIKDAAPDCQLFENNFFLDEELSRNNRSCKRAGLLYQLFKQKIEFDTFEKGFKALSLKSFT